MPKSATTRRPFQPDDFYVLRRRSTRRCRPTASSSRTPDARATGANERRTDIWVAPIDGSAAARRFTWGNRDHTPRWSPDGR